MVKYIIQGAPWYVHLSLIVSATLLVAGFCVPPTGIIDGSVLKGIAEMIGGTSLLVFVVNIPAYLDAGIKAKISHGETSITVAADEVKDSELEEEN